MLSCVELFVTPWTVTCQAPLFIKFSKQEYWSGLTFPTPGNLPDPGMESTFPTSLALAGSSLPLSHLGSQEVHERKCQLLSYAQLFVVPWTVAHKALPTMQFSRQEYWSGLPFPSPGDFPDPGIELGSPALQAYFLLSEPPGKQ